MNVAIIYQNKYGRWEAMTSDTNKARFTGSMFMGFDTREELESMIELFTPGQYILTNAEF